MRKNSRSKDSKEGLSSGDPLIPLPTVPPFMVSLEEELRKMWSKPIKSLPTFIDLGRLSNRIEILIEDEPEKRLTFEENHSKDTRAENLATCIQKVSDALENSVISNSLSSSIPQFLADTTNKLDFRSEIETLFQNFDENGPSIKIFKFVNQSALFIAITQMKFAVMAIKTALKPEALNTKDVRTPDGWRIQIKISNHEISVSHIRKEQSMNTSKYPDQWEMRWRFVTIFSPDMSSLLSTRVEVLEMKFASTFPPDLQNEIKRIYYESINLDFSFSELIYQPFEPSEAELDGDGKCCFCCFNPCISCGCCSHCPCPAPKCKCCCVVM